MKFQLLKSKKLTESNGKLPFETIILKHLFSFFEILTVLFLLGFLFFYYQQFLSIFQNNSSNDSQIQTSTESILQLGQYEQAVSFHEDKKAKAKAIQASEVKNPYKHY